MKNKRFRTILWHSKNNTTLRVPTTKFLFKYNVFGNSVNTYMLLFSHLYNQEQEFILKSMRSLQLKQTKKKSFLNRTRISLKSLVEQGHYSGLQTDYYPDNETYLKSKAKLHKMYSSLLFSFI